MQWLTTCLTLVVWWLSLNTGSVDSSFIPTNAVQPRWNYGVMFEPLRNIQIRTDVWRQIFIVSLPQLDVRGTETGAPTCESLRKEIGIIPCRNLLPMLRTLHAVHVNMSQHVRRSLAHILSLLPAGADSIQDRNAKRSLLPIAGTILRSLFGTATEEEDVKPLNEQLHIERQKTALVMDAVDKQWKEMTGLTKTMEERFSSLTDLVDKQQQVISETVRQLMTDVRQTASMSSIVMTVTRRLVDYITVIDAVNEFREGVERLLHGFLSPALISPETLQNTITTIDTEIQTKSPGTRLLNKHVSYYYNYHDYIFSRKGNDIIIQVQFPLTTIETPLYLYKVTSFAVPVSPTLSHMTQISNVPKFLIARMDYPYYLLPDASDITNVRTQFDISKQSSSLRSFNALPTCISALFQDNTKLIKELCKFRLSLHSVKPDVRKLTADTLLLLNISEIYLSCGNGQTRLVVLGCNACLRKVRCDCDTEVRIGNKTAFFLPRQSLNCHENNTVFAHITNLAVLQSFFKSEDLAQLAGASAVRHTVELQLPNFTVFNHKYKKMLARDHNLEYDLHKLANNVKNESTVYHSLSEFILDKKPIPDTSSTFDLLWNETLSSYMPILQTIAFFISLAAFCLALLLFYKVRVLSSALVLTQGLPRTHADDGKYPRLLTYFTSTKPPVVANMTESFYEGLYRPHVIPTGTIITILVIGFVTVMLYQRFLNNRQTGRHYLGLEIGNSETVVRVRCLNLPSAVGAYKFWFTKDVSKLWCTLLPARLYIHWDTLTIRHTILEELVSFPKVTNVNFLDALKIRRILQGKFYCVALLYVDEVTLMIRPTTDLPLESTDDDKTATVVTEPTCPSAPELFTRRMH